MEILDKKSNRMSRVNIDMSEVNLLASLSNLQRILEFLSLRNLLSNKLFFTFYYFATAPFYFFLNSSWKELKSRFFKTLSSKIGNFSGLHAKQGIPIEAIFPAICVS